jgi:hypothetical protein
MTADLLTAVTVEGDGNVGRDGDVVDFVVKSGYLFRVKLFEK